MSAHSEVRELLTMASAFDAQAREARRAAGRILALMRDSMDDAEIERATGLDAQTGKVLVRLATGAEAP